MVVLQGISAFHYLLWTLHPIGFDMSRAYIHWCSWRWGANSYQVTLAYKSEVVSWNYDYIILFQQQKLQHDHPIYLSPSIFFTLQRIFIHRSFIFNRQWVSNILAQLCGQWFFFNEWACPKIWCFYCNQYFCMEEGYAP